MLTNPLALSHSIGTRRALTKTIALDVVLPRLSDVRKLQGAVISENELQNARRGQGQFLNASADGVRDGAGYHRTDIQDRDLAGSLRTQWSDRGRALI